MCSIDDVQKEVANADLNMIDQDKDLENGKLMFFFFLILVEVFDS